MELQLRRSIFISAYKMRQEFTTTNLRRPIVLYRVLCLGHFPSIFEDVWTLQADGWNKTRELRERCPVHLKECLFLIDQIDQID